MLNRVNFCFIFRNKINLPETNGDLGKIINADITYDVQAESP